MGVADPRRRQGEHGPPRWRQAQLLAIARQLGVVPDEASEGEWLDRLLDEGNQKGRDRENASSRRYWWEVDGYCHYVLLCSLGSLYRDKAVGAPLRIPPEIDPDREWAERVKDRRLTFATLREIENDLEPLQIKRRKYDADQVAYWAFRYHREGVSFADLEREHHQALIAALEERRAGDPAATHRALARSDHVRRVVQESSHIWELAERDVGLA